MSEPFIHVFSDDEDGDFYGDVVVWLDPDDPGERLGCCIGCAPTKAEAIADARRSLVLGLAQLDRLEQQS